MIPKQRGQGLQTRLFSVHPGVETIVIPFPRDSHKPGRIFGEKVVPVKKIVAKNKV